jgi:hypothetical protein
VGFNTLFKRGESGTGVYKEGVPEVLDEFKGSDDISVWDIEVITW